MSGRLGTMFASIDPDPEWTLHFLGGTPGRTLVNVARDAHLLALGPESTPESAACWPAP
jgi:hypothetical protein